MDFGDKQNNIVGLEKLDDYRYENIFNVYVENTHYFYNIMNTLTFENLDNEEYYYFYKVDRYIPWTLISYENYKTIHLWWLICICNNIDNSTKFPEVGTILKVIKPDYIPDVLDHITKVVNG